MKRRPFALGLLLASVLSACGLPAQAPGAAETLATAAARRTVRSWQDDVIYFALLDRFQDGDRSNDRNVDRSNPTAYHGGDLQGLIDKLDYLQDLGITTLWVSPILDNDDHKLGDTNLWGYHGYWTKDFGRVEEHFGTDLKARELVTKAHARGMKVLLDVVCNQAGYEFPVQDARYQGWFHTHGNIPNGKWDDPWWSENGSLFGLPDFAQEKPEVASFLTSTYLSWADRLDLDGFRIDALKHVPQSFWSRFTTAAHQKKGAGFLTLGEILHGDPNVVASYQRNGKFDSLFDFPLYYTLNEVFAKGGSMRKLGERFAQDATYPDASMLSPFLDNHDVPRFLSQAEGDLTRLRLALACVLTVRGIPMLYYGTEVGMNGGQEPDNRADMAWGANPALRDYVKRLLAVRKSSPALQHGRQLEMWQDDDVYAYARQVKGDEAVVVLNNDGRTQSRTLPLRAESQLKDGTKLVDALTGESVTVSGGRIGVSLAGKQARILVRSPGAGSSRAR